MVDRKQQYHSLIYGKSFRRRAFYVLIFFLAMMTVYDVTNVTLEYLGNPKQANMNMNFNTSMTFPNLTFCMSKRQAWSHFGVNLSDKTQVEKAQQWGPNIENALANLTDHDQFTNRKTQWPPELVMSAYEAIEALNALERDSMAQQAMHDIKTFTKSGKKARVRKLVKNWLSAIEARNVSFAELTTKTGLEVLRMSLRRFERQSFNELDKFNMTTKITWISQKLFCFQPEFRDQDSFKPIEDQGTFFLMALVHDPKKLGAISGECISVDFRGRPTTMARNMEGKGRVKDGINEELCPGYMHELKAEIRAHYKMLENDDRATACRLYDDEESGSQFDCKSRCRMEMIREMCHCTPLTLQYLSDDKGLKEYPQCNYEKCEIPNRNFSDQQCAQKCLPHCAQIRYSLNLDQLGHSPNPEITTIKLIWGAFEYLELEQQYVWSLWTFVAAIGGSIGMWLGLSVLSLIQLITFLTERTAHKVSEKKKNKDTGKVSSSTGYHPGQGSLKDRPNYGWAKAEQPPPQYRPTDQHQHNGQPKGDNGRTNPSMNPFGGPVAVNIFESPFPHNKEGGGGGRGQGAQSGNNGIENHG